MRGLNRRSSLYLHSSLLHNTTLHSIYTRSNLRDGGRSRKASSSPGGIQSGGESRYRFHAVAPRRRLLFAGAYRDPCAAHLVHARDALEELPGLAERQRGPLGVKRVPEATVQLATDLRATTVQAYLDTQLRHVRRGQRWRRSILGPSLCGDGEAERGPSSNCAALHDVLRFNRASTQSNGETSGVYHRISRGIVVKRMFFKIVHS